MKSESDCRPKESKSAEHAKGAALHETNDPQTKIQSESRVPPLVMFEEEGTQTEDYNGPFFYGTSDSVELGDGVTDVNRVPSNSTTANARDMGYHTREPSNLSISSDSPSYHVTVDDGRVPRCDVIDDSSSLSESGESVIERLSKSVSRLLKPVILNFYLIPNIIII